MAGPRVCVVRAPGTNCDIETAHAFQLCGATTERLHLFQLLREPATLRRYEILCIPGGFSYGDDIGAGVIFGTQLRVHLCEALIDFLLRDTLVLGICNGFQVLVKSGLLPDGLAGLQRQAAEARNGGAHTGRKRRLVTLTWNDNGRYTCRWVTLRVDGSHNVFLRGLDVLEMPIAHAEGRVVVADPTLVDRWKAEGQIALRYTRRAVLLEATDDAAAGALRKGSLQAGARVEPVRSAWQGADASPAEAVPGGTVSPGEQDRVLPFPHNPNGSVANIAGLGDPSGRILGLMPHPERYLFAHQHPRWTRGDAREPGDGLALFRNAVGYFS